MITRRKFIAGAIALAAVPKAWPKSRTVKPVYVNDVHSQLNFTRVFRIQQPQSVAEVQRIIHAARKGRKAISFCGGRHAMGCQQFGSDTELIDIRKLNRVRYLDR